LAGRDGGDGIMAAHGIELALDDVNASPSEIHFRLEVRDTARGGFQDPHVDEGTDNVFDPPHGASDVAAYGRNPAVLGALGPLRSNVAAAEIPVAARYDLPLISGSADRRGSSGATFFSLSPSPRLIGYAAAGCAQEPLHLRRVIVVSDGTRDGDAVSAAFASRFAQRHGVLVGEMKLGRIEKDPAALARAIGRSHPDAVVFAPSAPLRAAFLSPGFARDVLTVESAGLMTFGAFDPSAQPGAKTGYKELRAVDASDSPDGQAFIERFKRRYQEFPSSDAARFYIAARLLMDAVRTAAEPSHPIPARSSVLAHLRSQTYDSFLGRVRFDNHGDLAGADFLLRSGDRVLARCPAHL
jgi:ABC-type branched-subunit amino acid transport system substrate-binding protein